MPDEAKNELHLGRISATTAQEISWLKNDETRREALRIIMKDDMNTRSARMLVRDFSKREEYESSDYEEYGVTMGAEEQTKPVEDAILILRVSLARLDSLIVKDKSPQASAAILAARASINGIIDNLVRLKMGRFSSPYQIQFAKRAKD